MAQQSFPGQEIATDLQRVRRHAVAATKIAAIDYRDSQIPKWSCQDILYWNSALAIHVIDAKLLLQFRFQGFFAYAFGRR